MKLVPRRRFRDRLLVGMVAVALLPLAGFAILAAFELDSVSRSTAAQAQGAILQDERDRQQTTAENRSGLIDARVAAISTELAHLSDSVNHTLASTAAVPVPDGLIAYGDTLYSGGIADPESVIASASGGTGSGRLLAAAAAALPQMQALRHDYPEIDTVWIASTGAAALSAAPGFDVKGAIDERLVDPRNLMLRSESNVFAPAQARLTSTPRGQWVDPTTSARQPGAPFWTDAYPLMASGNSGVSAWIPLADGQTVVGVDVSAASLVAAAVSQPNATPFPPAAYPLVLSSDGSVVYADPVAVKDFPTAGSLAGTQLNLPADKKFARGLHGVLASGRPAQLQTKLAGTTKYVFTAPIYGPQWVLMTPVPLGDLEPDLTGLTYGIAQGVHSLFPAVVLPALFLLLGLAFAAATVLSRRLVVPVRNLTRAAEVLAEGRTDVPVPPQGRDEVGVLAGALEHMRQEINRSHSALLAASTALEGRVERRTAELRTRNDELVALNDLAASLTRSLQAHVILGDAIDAVRAVQPLRAARGYLLDGDSLVTAGEWRRSDSDAHRTDALDAVAAAAIARGRMVRRATGRGHRLLAWPLVTAQEALGALAVETPVAPNADSLRLLQAIADQVALALRTAHLSAVGREHAVLEERTRLAREIHDTLAQQLTGIVLQLEAAQTLIDRGSDRAQATVTAAHELARSALQEARRSVWNLRPASLASTGLVAALEREVRAFGERTGIAARFRTHSLPRRLSLAPAAEVAMLRIAQEALANAARHSGAEHVDVELRADLGQLALSVRDDGSGFDVAASPARDDCFGLQGMRERIRLAGGNLLVASSPGAGTDVTAHIPLNDTAAVEHTA